MAVLAAGANNEAVTAVAQSLRMRKTAARAQKIQIDIAIELLGAGAVDALVKAEHPLRAAAGARRSPVHFERECTDIGIEFDHWRRGGHGARVGCFIVYGIDATGECQTARCRQYQRI